MSSMPIVSTVEPHKLDISLSAGIPLALLQGRVVDENRCLSNDASPTNFNFGLSPKLAA